MTENPKRILLADDDQSLRELMEMLLSAQGYSVHIANNGQEAIDAIQQTSFDLISLDLMMPVMDGIEVLTWIHTTQASAAPVVILTAVDQERTINQLFEVGASAVIHKPIDVAHYIEQIEQLLGEPNCSTISCPLSYSLKAV